MTRDASRGAASPPALTNGAPPSSIPERPSLADLYSLRTDYEDVPVPSLGGHVLRIYALSGTARAELFSEMADLADEGDRDAKDPATVLRVMMFQCRVVGASLGYPRDDWNGVGDALGETTIELLFTKCSALSKLDTAAQAKAVRRLRPKRSTASGTV